MKKIKFISALALTMVLASCENYDLPNPPGQNYPEPDGVFEGSGLVMTPAADPNINLVQHNADNKDVTVATITELVNFPAEYTLSIDMEIGNNDSFSNVATVATTVVNNETVEVNPDLFNAGIQEAITKQPGTLNVPVRFVAYAELGTTRMRLGGMTTTYCPETFIVRTLDPTKVIEDAYYIIRCDANGNPLTPLSRNAIKMQNTIASASPYDNPVFAVKFDVTEEEAAAGYRWKVAPQTCVDANDLTGVLGCKPAEDNELQGKLGDAYTAGSISLQGPVLVTVNMEEDSYSINYALEYLYPENGKPENALRLYTSNYITYQGVGAINTVFYLYGQPSKNGLLFKQDREEEPVISADGLTQTGILTPSSEGKQFKAPVTKQQLYWFDVNLVQRTYSMTCIQTLSVIGSGNGWNLETATALTPDKNKVVWTGTVEIGDEFKLNVNRAWTLDFGNAGNNPVAIDPATGNYNGNIAFKGSNISVNPGTYDVTVNFGDLPYTIKLVKK